MTSKKWVNILVKVLKFKSVFVFHLIFINVFKVSFLNESLQLSLILKFIIHCEKIDPVSNNGQLLNSYRFEIDLSAKTHWTIWVFFIKYILLSAYCKPLFPKIKTDICHSVLKEL